MLPIIHKVIYILIFMENQKPMVQNLLLNLEVIFIMLANGIY